MKMKSTYADGLLALVDEKTERIYTSFNQTVTTTGRISSTEPNLQNIPVKTDEASISVEFYCRWARACFAFWGLFSN